MRKAKEQSLVAHYLEELDSELRSMPASQRQAVLADVAEHIDEARGEGRTDVQIIDALGSVEDIAGMMSESVGEEGMPKAENRYRLKALGFAAVFVGLLAAAVDTWLYPSTGLDEVWPDWLPSSWINYGMSADFGAGFMLLFMIPTALVVVGAVIPLGKGQLYRVLAALVLSAAMFLLGLNLGVFYLPLVLVGWLMVAAGAGHKNPGLSIKQISLGWRLLAALVVLLAPVMLIAGMVSGAVVGDGFSVPIAVVLGLCGVGVALNWKAAHAALLVIGVLLLAMSVFSMGMIVLAVWLAGAIYLFLGLVGVLWLNPVRWLYRKN